MLKTIIFLLIRKKISFLFCKFAAEIKKKLQIEEKMELNMYMTSLCFAQGFISFEQQCCVHTHSIYCGTGFHSCNRNSYISQTA